MRQAYWCLQGLGLAQSLPQRVQRGHPQTYWRLPGHRVLLQLLLWVSTVFLVWSPSARADTSVGQALAAQRQCLGCHQVDARRVGPPFAAIARRFQGRADAAPYLAQQIRQGSRGRWGAIPMPAQSRVSETDAIQLARWILSLADAAPH